jgi:hypothetical protein
MAEDKLGVVREESRKPVVIEASKSHWTTTSASEQINRQNLYQDLHRWPMRHSIHTIQFKRGVFS